MKIKNIILLLMSFYSFAIAHNQKDSIQEINVQLNWKHQFEHAGFYAAIKQGYYSDVNIKVNLIEKNNSSSSFDEIVNKNADFAIGYSSLILEYVNDAPIVALASFFQHSPLILLTKADSNIRTVSDLVGKRVMLNPKSKSAASIIAMLKRKGILHKDIIFQKHSYDINDLINHKTDAVASYISNQPFELMQKGVKFNIIDPVNYGYDFYANILFTHKETLKNNPKLVNDFTKATLKGWKYALENSDEIIDVILEKYTNKKTKEALKYEAQIIKASLIPKNIPIGEIEKERFERIINLYEELGLIQKTNKNIDTFIYNEKNSIDLSIAQKKWLEKHPYIYFTGDPNWLPYEAFIEGNYKGIVNEHLNLIEQYTGIKFIKKPINSWSKAIDLAMNKEVDVLSETTSSLLEDKLTFTKSYLSSPIVMIMNKDADYKNSMEDIKEKKIAVIKNYGYISKIKKQYPNLDYYEVENIQEGLLAVENNNTDVFLSALPQASYWINKQGLQNTRIVGKTKYLASLAFAVRPDYQILVDILNKAISQITPTQQQEILTKWSKATYVEKIDYTLFIMALFISLLVISVLIIRNNTLAKNHDKLEQLSQTDNLTKIYNRVKLHSVLEEQLKFFNRYKDPFGVLLIDIDYFKKVNDEFGHDIGDIVLVEFAQLLKSNIRDVDYIGRWGGEEFLIICPKMSVIGMKKLGEKLRAKIENHTFTKIGTKTASFGLSICKPNSNEKTIIKEADIALYEAKAKGRNKVVYI